jgi:hypothetical protein
MIENLLNLIPALLLPTTMQLLAGIPIPALGNCRHYLLRQFRMLIVKNREPVHHPPQLSLAYHSRPFLPLPNDQAVLLPRISGSSHEI